MDSVTINGGVDTSVKIRLIGHCIICLKKLSTEAVEECKEDEQGYPEAVPKSLVSTPGFLGTFHEIWGYLQSGSDSEGGTNGGGDVLNGNSGKGRSISSFGIALERVVAAGSQINVTFSRTPSPTICHQCFNKTLAVENMMKVVRHQVREIERLVKASRKEGKFGGRAEQIQKTLQVFTLEVDDRGAVDEEDDNDNVHLDSEDDKNRKEHPKRKRGRPPKPRSEISVDFAGQDDNPNNSEDSEEETPKRRRGRPPKRKSIISENESSRDSVSQEDNSMDSHRQDDNNEVKKTKDKEDPDFEIKTEPQDYSEDDGDDGGGSNYSDEYLPAGSSATSMMSSSSKSKSVTGGSLPQRIRWQTIEMTDEEIAKNWRLQCTKSQKKSSVFKYYCAQGKTCGMQIQKKVLKNGAAIITTNGRDHSNHRVRDYGLTQEQKEFTMECIEMGVNTPNLILASFRAKKTVRMPEKRKLTGWLERYRYSERTKDKTSKKSDEVGEGVEEKKGEESAVGGDKEKS